MKIRNHFSLKTFNSFNIQAITPQILFPTNIAELTEIATKHFSSFYVLGEGSNTLFCEDEAPVIVKPCFTGVEVNEDDWIVGVEACSCVVVIDSVFAKGICVVSTVEIGVGTVSDVKTVLVDNVDCVDELSADVDLIVDGSDVAASDDKEVPGAEVVFCTFLLAVSVNMCSDDVTVAGEGTGVTFEEDARVVGVFFASSVVGCCEITTGDVDSKFVSVLVSTGDSFDFNSIDVESTFIFVVTFCFESSFSVLSVDFSMDSFVEVVVCSLVVDD